MRRSYQIAERNDSEALAEFLAQEGQLLLPMVQLIEEAELAVDELIDVVGRATLEAVLLLSAEQVAGPKQRGKRRPDREAYWHGSQPGLVSLAERKLRVRKPRLRKKAGGAGGELELPAYEAMRGGRLGERMLEILLCGVSTRRYKDVLPQMADTVGISKSEVSRQTIEAGERVLQDLAERRFDDKEILIVYIDGIQFGSHHIVAAVGVDGRGRKHVLGMREGASENATVAVGLLEELVERGVKPERRRLFVIDGAKALRKAIDQVYGSGNPIQRCRNHKIRNVLGHLPDDQQEQANSAMRAAFKLDADEGIKRLEQLALWLERDHPTAASSLREGLREMFTVNRLGLPPELRRCLSSTNLIDSTHSGVRQKTDRVTNWQSGSMVLRWAAAAFMATEKSYRRILGYRKLWILKAHLDAAIEQEVADEKKVG
jgi:transposase-like protein